MCFTYLPKKWSKKRASRGAAKTDPTTQTTPAIPPMPMRQNSRGEYVRETPWHSGGMKAATILDRAVSHPSQESSSNRKEREKGDWVRGLMVGQGGIWEERGRI